MLYSLLASLVLCISKASSFSTLITFDVDGTLVSSSPGKQAAFAIVNIEVHDDDGQDATYHYLVEDT